VVNLYVIIACQHATHAQRMANPSICLSNVGTVTKEMHISSYFFTIW